MPKEYIEREKLIRHLKDEIEACANDCADFHSRKFGIIWGLRGALSYANTLPAADVVEAVRCLNCVYWDGMGYEGRCEAPTNGLIREYTNYDDFCSYGERKMRGNENTTNKT